jgi:hypothetical protein
MLWLTVTNWLVLQNIWCYRRGVISFYVVITGFDCIYQQAALKKNKKKRLPKLTLHWRTTTNTNKKRWRSRSSWSTDRNKHYLQVNSSKRQIYRIFLSVGWGRHNYHYSVIISTCFDPFWAIIKEKKKQEIIKRLSISLTNGVGAEH